MGKKDGSKLVNVSLPRCQLSMPGRGFYPCSLRFGLQAETKTASQDGVSCEVELHSVTSQSSTTSR
jgi:hypothetical protein